ncbi:hypothetical protein Tco_1424710 [Tanacetum coccineum]
MSTARVILFGTIPTTIPSTAPTTDLPIIHDDTLLISTETPTIPPIAPNIQYTSSFICTDSSDSDTSERQPSHDPYKVTVARWRSRVAALSSPSSPPIRYILPAPLGLPYRPAVLVLPRQSIPVGRPYRTHPNGVQTSSDSHSDTSSDSSSRHSSSGHPISYSPCDSPTAISAGPSRKKRMSPATLVPVPGALSLVHADLLLPRKRIRDSDSVTDFEVSSEEGLVPYVPREVGLGVDVENSYDPYTEPDIDFDIQADIDACILAVDAITAGETEVRVEVETVAEEEAESSVRGTIKIGVDRVTHPVVSNDTAEPAREDFPELVSADGSVV